MFLVSSCIDTAYTLLASEQLGKLFLYRNNKFQEKPRRKKLVNMRPLAVRIVAKIPHHPRRTVTAVTKKRRRKNARKGKIQKRKKRSTRRKALKKGG